MSGSLSPSLPEGAPQSPLGGVLVDRVLRGDERGAALERSANLAHLVVDAETAVVLELIATGVFSPLIGFAAREESAAIIETGRLLDGTPWPIPIWLAPTGRRNRAVLARLQEGDEVLLVDHQREPLALLEIEQIYPRDDSPARSLFGEISGRDHPGVTAMDSRMGETALAGPIRLLQRPSWGAFERYRLTPAESYRLLYGERSYRTVAGFVTGANPLHTGHEHMHRAVLETLDAILLLPQVSMERPEYIKDVYRVAALDALLDAYYPTASVVVGGLRNQYMFAGPREAVLHALVMRNYGCTHALIGRDHAGVGDLFDMYAGQRIFGQYAPGELGIETLFFSEVFYCSRCRSTATEKTCAHDTRYRLQISGTGIRELLRRGYFPPKEICRPEVSQIALQGVRPHGGPLGSACEGSVYPPGQTIRSLFSFYETADRLGGHLRPEPLPPEALGERDLRAALLDARTHCDEIYAQVFDEIAYAAESNRSMAPRWRSEAREILLDHQADLAERLREGREPAPEEAQAGERLAGYAAPVYPESCPPDGPADVRRLEPEETPGEEARPSGEWELPT